MAACESWGRGKGGGPRSIAAAAILLVFCQNVKGWKLKLINNFSCQEQGDGRSVVKVSSGSGRLQEPSGDIMMRFAEPSYDDGRDATCRQPALPCGCAMQWSLELGPPSDTFSTWYRPMTGWPWPTAWPRDRAGLVAGLVESGAEASAWMPVEPQHICQSRVRRRRRQSPADAAPWLSSRAVSYLQDGRVVAWQPHTQTGSDLSRFTWTRRSPRL